MNCAPQTEHLNRFVVVCRYLCCVSTDTERNPALQIYKEMQVLVLSSPLQNLNFLLFFLKNLITELYITTKKIIFY